MERFNCNRSVGSHEISTGRLSFDLVFGPRGLAGIVFAIIVLNKHLPGGSINPLVAVLGKGQGFRWENCGKQIEEAEK